MIAEFDAFCLWTYVIVDELWRGAAGGLQAAPRASALNCSDSELGTMALVGECRGWTKEPDLVQEWRARRHLSPIVPERTRFNRWRRNLLHAINALRRGCAPSSTWRGTASAPSTACRCRSSSSPPRPRRAQRRDLAERRDGQRPAPSARRPLPTKLAAHSSRSSASSCTCWSRWAASSATSSWRRSRAPATWRSTRSVGWVPAARAARLPPGRAWRRSATRATAAPRWRRRLRASMAWPCSTGAAPTHTPCRNQRLGATTPPRSAGCSTVGGSSSRRSTTSAPRAARDRPPSRAQDARPLPRAVRRSLAPFLVDREARRAHALYLPQPTAGRAGLAPDQGPRLPSKLAPGPTSELLANAVTIETKACVG